MKIERFEDIIAWRVGRELVCKVYDAMRHCNDYSFRDQMQRAAISVTNNIAEGFGRLGNKEFIRYLKMAKGSCLEVRSMSYIALDIGVINDVQFDDFILLTIRIEKLLVNFIRALQINEKNK